MNAGSAQLNSESPLLFKRKAAWEGLRLDHCGFQSGELPEHCHREHTVLLSLSEGCRGELTTASGSRVKGPKNRGSVCVLPSGLAHTARFEGSSEHLALYLDPALLHRNATDLRVRGNFEVVERFRQRDPIISAIGMALLAELSDGSSGRLYAESLANVLAVHVLRNYTTSRDTVPGFRGGLSGRKLRQVMDFIAANYANDLRLEELAREASMSSFHFAREFKKSTGTTPHQYLIKFRVEQAKLLLANRELPLTEVGLRSGFSHQSHFTRLFHRFTGTTPQSYRQRLT